MISVNTNVTSLIAQRTLRYNQSQLNLSLERLSTGLRINRASDDPAGLIASENLRSEKVGVQAAIDNATRAGNVAATAEGGLNEVSSLLNQLQGLVSQSANAGGLSNQELAANQLQADSILDTIDRITGQTKFAGQPLLNGALDYNVAGVDPTAIAGLSIHRTAGVPGQPISVVVNVLASAQTAGLTYTGGAIGAGGTTIEIAGNEGTTQLTFSSGTSIAAVASAITKLKSTTGISASVVGGNVELHSTAYGSKSFVKVRTIAGSFAGATGQAAGRNAWVTVNGATAVSDGINITATSGGLDLSFSLLAGLNTTNGSSSFTITGGGASFQIGSKVDANGFATIGLPSTSTASIGSSVYGSLSSLRSGGAASLTSGNLIDAQKILTASISDVSYSRARLGAFIKYEVGSTINSLSVQLENLTDAESQIRDTDFAAETSRLTRFQILTQAATSILSIANQAPSIALTLLNNTFNR